MPPFEILTYGTDRCSRKASQTKIEPYKLSDGKSLYLLIQPAGGKYWRWKYRIAGKEKLLALGVYPEIPLADTRKARDEACQTLRDGVDPAEQRKHHKRLRKIQAANSFEAIARQWHDKQAGRWSDSHTKKVMHSFERDILPRIAHRPITRPKC